MTGREKRRYPKRFPASVPIEFMDKTRTKGSLVNVSRDGILVVCKKAKPINSFVRLLVFLPNFEEGVTINGKVVRHSVVNQSEAMGIQFFEQDAKTRDAWLDFLSSFTRSFKSNLVDTVVTNTVDLTEAVIAEGTPDSGAISRQSQFVLRFKSRERIEEFFPNDWQNDEFFIQTHIKKNKGDRILVRMVHPDSQEELRLNSMVEKYGQHPQKTHKEGIFFKIVNYDATIEGKIRTFLGIEEGLS